MRVSSPLTSSYFYPDVVVVCEEPRFEDDVFDTLLNPIILVESFHPQPRRMIAVKNSRITDNSRRCRNTSSSPKTRFLLNTTTAKKNRGPHLLRGKTGFSPISKNLRKFCHSPPSNANCLCGKSTNASHFPISAGTAHKRKIKIK